MNIIKRIKLGSKNYYIVTCCEYINDELRLKDYKDNYYDGGDLSRLIEEVIYIYQLLITLLILLHT